MNTREYDVLSFGAAGDGVTLDTIAIQSAIDACNKAGGGTVYFAPGRYLSGTIYLKSNVSLHLEASATIQGSDNISDYELCGFVSREDTPPSFSGGYLIYAENIENAGIVGRGTIDGQGRAFWTAEKYNETVVAPKDERPRAMIYMTNCRDLLFRDISLKCSPCFTLWMLGCDTVNIDGVSIINPYDGPNTDGLDIDCCRNVRVSNCRIEAGDDCIALKSDASRLGENRPCENIVVTNCTLSSPTCGVRVGYEGDAPIRNCTFSNLSMYNTRTGIDILSVVPAKPWIMIRKGALIEGIVFDNIAMMDVARPIYIWLGNETDEPLLGKIRNIKISNIIAYASNTSYIGGCEEVCIDGVELNNVKLVMRGDINEPDLGVPDVWGGDQQPHGVIGRYVNGLRMNGLHIDWTSATGNWQNQILAENVKDIEISSFSSEQCALVSQLPAIHLRDVQRAFIHGCGAETMQTFLHVDGLSSRDISLIGNELSRADCAFEIDGLDECVLFQSANHLPDTKVAGD